MTQLFKNNKEFLSFKKNIKGYIEKHPSNRPWIAVEFGISLRTMNRILKARGLLEYQKLCQPTKKQEKKEPFVTVISKKDLNPIELLVINMAIEQQAFHIEMRNVKRKLFLLDVYSWVLLLGQVMLLGIIYLK